MRRALVAAAAAMALALAGCGEDASGPAPSGEESTAVAGPAPGLQVRPVLGPGEGVECGDSGDPVFPGNPAPDQEIVLCDLAGDAYRLGPAAVVGGVERVTRSTRRIDGFKARAVGIRLARDEARAVVELARSRASSDDRLAVVVDGFMMSGSTAIGTVGGRLLLVAGQFTKAQVDEFVARLAP